MIFFEYTASDILCSDDLKHIWTWYDYQWTVGNILTLHSISSDTTSMGRMGCLITARWESKSRLLLLGNGENSETFSNFSAERLDQLLSTWKGWKSRLFTLIFVGRVGGGVTECVHGFVCICVIWLQWNSYY